MLAIDNYPLAIDPLANAIEAMVGPDKQLLSRRQLGRLSTLHVHQALPLCHKDVHFFGDGPDLEGSGFFLAYGQAGDLRSIARWTAQDGWGVHELPGECTGAAELLPSLRLVFEDKRAVETFLYYLRSVRDGSISNPALAIPMGRLRCIHELPVYTPMDKQHGD